MLLNLPQPYQDLYRADRLRGRELIREILPSDLAAREADVSLSAALDRAADAIGEKGQR